MAMVVVAAVVVEATATAALGAAGLAAVAWCVYVCIHRKELPPQRFACACALHSRGIRLRHPPWTGLEGSPEACFGWESHC